ncbi:hypothetical protein N9C35_03090, partial [Flavobacteriaceae bacterium]|nr:hypothetical protein [Flavobacteriaceae bacterium]
MKIINILLSNKNGGVEDAFITHCEILQKAGGTKNNILAIVKTGAPYADCLANLGIEVIEVKNNFGYYDFIAQRKIAKIISNFSPNLVSAHVGRGIYFAKKILHKQNIALLAVNHSNNVKRSIGADAILCVNEEIHKKAVSLGQNPKKTWTIPNVIKFDEKEIIKIPYNDFSANSEIIIGAMGR